MNGFDSRFGVDEFRGDQKQRLHDIGVALNLAWSVMNKHLMDCEEKDRAVDRLREAFFWCDAGIMRETRQKR